MSSPNFTVQRLLELGRVQAVVPDPTGTFLVVCVAHAERESAKFVPHLYRVTLADGAVTRLTRGPHKCYAPAFRADGSLAFLSTRPTAGSFDGNTKGDDESERAQVWVLPRDGGEAWPLTDEPHGVLAFRAARNADVIALFAPILPNVLFESQRERAKELAKKGPTALHYKSMPVRYWDHWLERAVPHLVVYAGRTRSDLTPSADREYREGELALSDDGRWIAVTETRLGADRIDDVGMRVFDRIEGTSRVLSADASVQYGALLFAPDGKRIACTRSRRSREAHGKSECVLFDRESGSMQTLAASWDRWPMPQAFTHDGASLVVIADDEGTVPVFAIDVATGKVQRITASAAGGSHDHVSLLADGKTLVGLRHAFTQPPEPFVASLEPDATPRLVARLSGLEAPLDLASVSRVEVPAADGFEVHAFVVKPRHVERAPVLFWIHGGPVGQFSDGWHWRWNPMVFASLGFAIVLSNPRGSTGRGQAFVEGIWNNSWGGACADDLMRIADAIVARTDVDGTRMIAMGGSFGGYMANWLGGSTDRFRGIVTHASLFHMDAFALTTDVPAWFQLEIGGGPIRERELFDKYSPHRRVTNWKTPALVIHGEKDYRVPIGEGLALFEALQLHGVESELLVFPDEGHWIDRPRNIESWYESIGEWVKKRT